MTRHQGMSVFTDDSGSRRRRVIWSMRTASALVVLSVTAVAVSMVGHVTLPGLDEPLHLPGTGRAPADRASEADRAPSARASSPSTSPADAARLDAGAIRPQATGVSTPADVSPSGTTAGTPASSAPSSRGPVTSPSTARPQPVTPPATSQPRGKPTARPVSAAEPVHAPGSPPTDPPGRTKKTSSAP